MNMRKARRPHDQVVSVIRWFTGHRSATHLPFYCDPDRVGAFAVAPVELARADEAALFRLFVCLSMFQALRDSVIMRQQRSLRPAVVRRLADANFVRRSITAHGCPTLNSVEAFEAGCDVFKTGRVVDCDTCPGVQCHVKDATVGFNRMGDMGKLPTSAWLRIWRADGLPQLLAEINRSEASPTKRAHLLVSRFARVHRVGRKLATLFVSALSTPALAPGLAPWFPEINGHDLVVADTNVARALGVLGGRKLARTYAAREAWVRSQARAIDLRQFDASLPSYSPRFIQEALYAFSSRSNRVAAADECASRVAPCADCASRVCPFAAPAIAKRPTVPLLARRPALSKVADRIVRPDLPPFSGTPSSTRMRRRNRR